MVSLPQQYSRRRLGRKLWSDREREIERPLRRPEFGFWASFAKAVRRSFNIVMDRRKLPSNECTNVRFDTQDGLYDLAWSEVHQNQIVTGSGDGSLKLWDIALNVRLHPFLRFSLRLTGQKLGLSNSGVAGTHEGGV